MNTTDSRFIALRTLGRLALLALMLFAMMGAAFAETATVKLPAPILTGPADGGTLDLSSGVVFSYTYPTGAVSLHDQFVLTTDLTTRGDFTKVTPALDTTYPAIGTPPTVLLETGKFYSWRVMAVGDGTTYSDSDWSTVWNFKTIGTPPVVTGLTLTSPADKATQQSVNPWLVWSYNSYTDANFKDYHLQVAIDSGFAKVVRNHPSVLSEEGTTNRHHRPNGPLWQIQSALDRNTIYYWRVCIVNKDGTEREWIGPRSFTTTTFGPVVLNAPADNATNVPRPVQFSWSGAEGANGYNLQVDINVDFTSSKKVIDKSVGSSTTYSATELGGSTTYFWRVQPKSSSATGPWSDAFMFTTMGVPGPTLLSPTNDPTHKTPVALPVQLRWSAPTETTGYQLLVAMKSGVSFDYLTGNPTSIFTPIIDTGTMPKTKVPDLSALKAGIYYYWCVRSVDSSSGVDTFSDYSAVWSFTTVGYAPGVPTQLTPKYGATGVVTPIDLTWTSIPMAYSYRVQYSTSANFSDTSPYPTDTTGLTKLTTNSLNAKTTYYWRVQAYNDLGNSSWSPIWSFTTKDPTPAVPVLISPTTSSTGVTSPITFTWGASTGATKYTIQLSTSSAFSGVGTVTTTVTPSSLTSPTVTFDYSGSLTSSTIYYWHVSASASSGYSTYTSAYSAPFSFVTATLPPAAPVLAFPGNFMTIDKATASIGWYATTGASSYEYVVSTDRSMTDATKVVAGSANLTSSQLSVLMSSMTGLQYSTDYYWHVRAGNNAGMGDWSVVIWSFTTAAAPKPKLGTPTLLTPSYNSTNVSITTSLTWSAVTNATGYVVDYGTDPQFVTKTTSSVATTKFTPTSALQPSTLYYWRVKAVDTGYPTTYLDGDVSTSFSFTTGKDVAAPTLTAPTNGATGVNSTTLVYTWTNATNNKGYHLQVSTTTGFTAIVQDTVTAIPDISSQAATGLLPGGRYYWRVATVSKTIGESDWSAVYTFTTLAAPTTPVLTLPVNNTINVNPASQLIMQWNAVTNATSYIVNIATGANSTNTTVTTNYLTLPAGTFQYSTNYTWHVTAVGGAGNSQPSTDFKFSTIAVPSKVIPLSPTTGSTGVSVLTPFIWQPVTAVLSYNLQVSTSTSFTSPVVSLTGLKSTSYTLTTALTPGTLYYYRVQAVNAAGAGDWSNATSFTTIATPAPPSLLVPLNGNTRVQLPVQLAWSTVSAATGYYIRLSTSATFTTNVVSYTSSGTQLELNVFDKTNVIAFQTGVNYYWQVASKNAVGTGAWSTTFSFAITPNVPGIVNLVSPANGSVLNGSSTNTLRWTATAGISDYWVQVAKDPSFTNLVISNDHVSATWANPTTAALNPYYTLYSLDASTLYYWRIRGWNTAGQGSWSTSWYFSTYQNGGSNLISAPTPDTTGTFNTSPVLTWSPVPGATGYQIIIKEAAGALIINTDAIYNTSYTFQNGRLGVNYTWQVAAWNSTGRSPLSVTVPFVIVNLDAPILLYPNPAPATTSSLTPSFYWTLVPGATSYSIQIAKDALFQQIVLTKTGLGPTVSTYVLTTPLISNRTYYWRVTAANSYSYNTASSTLLTPP